MKKFLAVFIAGGLVLVLLGGGCTSTPKARVGAAGGARVNLGAAGNYEILAKAGISNIGATHVMGDIGLSPMGGNAITGFGLMVDSSKTFATSAQVTGKVYAGDYTPPTSANMTAAVSAMVVAYTDAASREASVVELGAGNIGGRTLTPGVYKWSTGVSIPMDLTLNGGPDDVWIFQVAGTLELSSAKKVILSGGAQAANIFWQAAGQTTLGTTSIFNGNILDQAAIVLNTGATLNGKALSQTAVMLNAATVGLLGNTPTPTPTPTPAAP